MYMLDTNTCIFAIRGAQSGKYRFVTETIRKKCQAGLCISTVTLAELQHGVAGSALPEKNAAALLNFLAILDVLPFDESAASAYGSIKTDLQRRGIPIGALDTLIAAHSLSAHCVLVPYKPTRAIKNTLLRPPSPSGRGLG